MYDLEIVIDLLQKLQEALNKIQVRMQSVKSVSDLTDSTKGVEKLDLLCMPLIVIGELVKKIEKVTDQSLLKNYPTIPWAEIKGMRNIGSWWRLDALKLAFLQTTGSLFISSK